MTYPFAEPASSTVDISVMTTVRPPPVTVDGGGASGSSTTPSLRAARVRNKFETKGTTIIRQNINMLVIPTGIGTAGTANPTIETASKIELTTTHPHHGGSRRWLPLVDDDEVVVLTVVTTVA